MKRYSRLFLFVIALVTSTTLSAQMLMNIQFNNGSLLSFPVNEISKVTWEATIQPIVETGGMLSGFVRSTTGSAIQGVEVSSGDLSTTTNQDGFYSLSNVQLINGRVVVNFSHYSYADVVRSFKYESGQTLDVVMTPTYSYYGQKNPSVTSNFSSSIDCTIAVNSESKDMRVDLQADGFKNAETGAAYTGQVTASVTYLNPDAKDFADQMPGGDLAAKDKDGKEVQLISYGMSLVDLKGENGEKLQLNGKPATVTFPVPEGMKNDPRVINHDDIPLWSFNEQTGLWEEEGVAKYNAELDAYVGTVTHFSWVNCDYPEVRATIKGSVKDQAGNPIPYQKVYVGQVTTSTNDKGEFELYVPKDTEVKVWIRSVDYGNYADGEEQVISTTVAPLAQGAVGRADLVMPTLVTITGTVSNKGTGGNVATVWIEYNKDGQKLETKRVRSDAKGAFKLQAPVGYTGEATVRVSSADGKVISKSINLTGKDINIGTITIESNTSNSGKLTFNIQGQGTIEVPINNVGYYDKGGVTILGNQLEVDLSAGIDWEEMEKQGGYFIHGHGFTIENYSPSQKSYTTGPTQMALINMSSDVGRENWIMFDEGVNVDVVRNGDAFTFTITGGKGIMQEIEWVGEEEQWTEKEVTIGGSFTMDLYYEAERAQNVAATDSRIPSFIQSLLTGPADYAIFVKQGKKLGKGCNLAYDNKTREDFDNLKAKAAKLGLKDYSADYGYDQDDQSASAVYYSNGKYLKIVYCPYRYGTIEPWGIDAAVAPISIIAFDGTMFYVSDLEYFVKKATPSGPWDARKK